MLVLFDRSGLSYISRLTVQAAQHCAVTGAKMRACRGLLQELIRKWQTDIRSQQRAIERQIRDLERDRKTAEKQVREAAKRGDLRSAKLIAKEIVNTKKVIKKHSLHYLCCTLLLLR